MSTLYENSDRRNHEISQSVQSLEKLSIEYNPLNQIKKDLGVITRKEELDQENLGIHLEIKELQSKFGQERRVVDVPSIIEFCAGNGYTIKTIRDYRSELTQGSLEAIQKFSNENSIDISRNKDNFFILAPRRFFERENLNIDNVAFNIYYRKEYSSNVRMKDNLVEIYGSNFNSGFFSPITEIFSTQSSDEKLCAKGSIIISIISLILFAAITLIVGGVLMGGLIFFNFVFFTLVSIILIEYKAVFASKKFLKVGSNIDYFISNGDLKI